MRCVDDPRDVQSLWQTRALRPTDGVDGLGSLDLTPTSPDVILLDINLGAFYGVYLCSYALAHARRPPVWIACRGIICRDAVSACVTRWRGVVATGVDICRAMRGAGVLCPVIAMTANSEPHEVEVYRQAGFNGLLPKPFSYGMLQRLLNAVVNGECAAWVVACPSVAS